MLGNMVMKLGESLLENANFFKTAFTSGLFLCKICKKIFK